MSIKGWKRKKWTPLHVAGSGEVVSLLLSRGADATARDDDGNTPLHTLSGFNEADSVEAILKVPSAVALISTRNKGVETQEEMTPLHLSIIGATVEVDDQIRVVELQEQTHACETRMGGLRWTYSRFVLTHVLV